MRAADTAYPVEKHMASVSLVFDDKQNAYIRELSEEMNLDFGEFIPHVTLINVTEQDMPRLKLAAAALPFSISWCLMVLISCQTRLVTAFGLSYAHRKLTG